MATFNYRGIVNQDPANAFLDNTGQKWWNGIPTIQAKTELAINEVSGIMIWEIGQDAFGANIQYSLLRTIDEVVDNAVLSTSGSDQTRLNIFPNPVRDRIFIHWNESEAHRLIITDLQGKIMLENDFNGNALQEISVQDLPTGMYTVLAMTGSGVQAGRFVKTN